MHHSLTEIAQYFSSWRIDVWLQVMLVALIVVIAFISFFKFQKYRTFQEENTTFHAIENLYGLFHKLSLGYNDWRLSHLFCVTTESYNDKVNKIISSFDISDPEALKRQVAEHQVREENMVINILLFYEQVFYQHKHSTNLEVRKEFLRLIDRYFKERLLLNPRVVHFIIKSECGKEVHLEEESVLSLADKYEDILRANSHTRIFKDSLGPFDYERISSKKKINSIKEITLEKFMIWRKGDRWQR